MRNAIDFGPCCWPLCDDRADELVENVGYCHFHADEKRGDMEPNDARENPERRAAQ